MRASRTRKGSRRLGVFTGVCSLFGLLLAFFWAGHYARYWSADDEGILGGVSASGGLVAVEDAMVLSAALADWVRSTAHHRPSTVDTIHRSAKRWAATWGAARPLDGIGPDLIREYLGDLRDHFKASTTNQERSMLSWFFGHCRRRGWVQVSPVTDAERYPEDRRTARTLTDQECQRLISCAVEPIKTAVILAIETGLRRQAILALRWEWIDIDGWLHVPGEWMKSRQDYAAPLSSVALEATRRIRTATTGSLLGLSRTRLFVGFDLARKRAGVACKFHDLRRTFFTLARQRGVPLEVAMALSDHRDYRTALRHYRAISPDELMRAVGRGPQAGGARRDLI